MLINFEPSGKNRWNLRIDGGKKGHIKKERGSFVATITRHVHYTALDGICFFVAELNRQR